MCVEEIKSVVLNLIFNALESVDEGGRLAIELRQREGMAEMDECSGRGWATLEGDELRGMIFIHGGSWQSGDRSQVASIAACLPEQF